MYQNQNDSKIVIKATGQKFQKKKEGDGQWSQTLKKNLSDKKERKYWD